MGRQYKQNQEWWTIKQAIKDLNLANVHSSSGKTVEGLLYYSVTYETKNTCLVGRYFSKTGETDFLSSYKETPLDKVPNGRAKASVLAGLELIRKVMNDDK